MVLLTQVYEQRKFIPQTASFIDYNFLKLVKGTKLLIMGSLKAR